MERDQEIDRKELAERIRIAFDGANNADIARRLDTSDPVIKAWMDGDRLPGFELLIRITRRTGVNLHWLMTGSGPRRVEPDRFPFSMSEELAIREMAKESGRTFEEQVSLLANAAAEFLRKTR